MTDFDTDYEDEIVCPHCGHRHDGSDIRSDTRFDCYECGKPFFVVVNYEVTYSTFHIKEMQD